MDSLVAKYLSALSFIVIAYDSRVPFLTVNPFFMSYNHNCAAILSGINPHISIN